MTARSRSVAHATHYVVEGMTLTSCGHPIRGLQRTYEPKEVSCHYCLESDELKASLMERALKSSSIVYDLNVAWRVVFYSTKIPLKYSRDILKKEL